MLRCPASPLYLLPALVLVQGAGCVEDGEEDGDSTAEEQCPPPTLTLTASWGEDDLPQEHTTQGSQPGLGLGDLDGDSDLDLLFAYAGGSLGFRNDGQGNLFPDDTITLDGGPLPWAQSTALADLDGDGDLDAFLGRWLGELDLLMFNDGTGAFTSHALPDSEGATYTASFADADGDGRLDLFLGMAVSNMDGAAVVAGEQHGDGNRFYLQESTGEFFDATDRLPEEVRPALTFQGAWMDVDEDGDLDVYLVNDGGPFVLPNFLLRNDGHAGFTRDESCGCELAILSMGAAVGDANGDGRADVYISDVGGPNLLVGAGNGQFVDATLALGADVPATERSMTSWGTQFLDVNQDREPDLVLVFGRLGDNADLVALVDPSYVDGDEQEDVMFLGGKEGFTPLSSEVFGDPDRGRAVVVGDLDRDGKPDLVTAGKHWLKTWRTGGGCEPGITLSLDAGPGNAEGIGSRVEVAVNGEVRTTWMLPSSMASSSAPELYLGLGGAPQGDLLITWPDGTTEERQGVPSGTALRVSR